MKHVWTGIKITIFFIIVCGIIYPLVLTGIGQAAINKKANGSLVYVNGKAIGSELIGQDFSGNGKYFEGRPSSINYNETKDKSNIAPKSGSNALSPSSIELKDRVNKEVNEFLKENPTVKRENLPADLFTVSASGLDPDISLKAATIQIDRVAKNTGISKEKLQKFINESKESLSPKGETLINVLELNLKVAKDTGTI